MASKTKSLLLSALLCGFCAGFLNGLFGTGGGIAIVFFLTALWRDSEHPDRERAIFATCNAVILILSLCSLTLYLCWGRLTPKILRESIVYDLAAVPGGLLGAYLLRYIKPRLLRKCFAALLVFGGIRMVL